VRIRRATENQFLNAHVIHPNDYQKISNPPPGLSTQTMWQNYFQGMHRNDERNEATRRRNPYFNRDRNTFILGTDNDASNAFVNGQVCLTNERY